MNAILIRDGKRPFHFTKTATEKTPKGTLMYHYALEGTKEELDAYEEAKGEHFSKVEDGIQKDKPIWFTSKKYPENLEVNLDKDGFLREVESLDIASDKAEAKKKALAEEREKIAKEERVFALAQRFGITLAV